MLAMTPSENDLATQFEALRPDLTRFARLQLRDTASAEDAVQETLLAALCGEPKFENRSALKTWLFAILRHKVVDLIRTRVREVPVSALGDNEDDDAMNESLFDRRGHWTEEARPGRWNDPAASFEQQQFWAIFEACLDRLPERTARIFMMREFLGLETDEICRELAVSSANCWVVLHRARSGLRLCLEQKWFAGA